MTPPRGGGGAVGLAGERLRGRALRALWALFGLFRVALGVLVAEELFRRLPELVDLDLERESLALVGHTREVHRALERERASLSLSLSFDRAQGCVPLRRPRPRAAKGRVGLCVERVLNSRQGPRECVETSSWRLLSRQRLKLSKPNGTFTKNAGPKGLVGQRVEEVVRFRRLEPALRVPEDQVDPRLLESGVFLM